MKKRFRRRSGFTLAEVICAIVLLLIFAVGLMPSIISVRKMISRSANVEQASARAQTVADTVIAGLWKSNLKDASSSSFVLSAADLTRINSISGAFYTDTFSYSSSKAAQYRLVAITSAVKKNVYKNGVIMVNTFTDIIGYHIYVRIYYNGGADYTDLDAYADIRGGDWGADAS